MRPDQDDVHINWIMLDRYLAGEASFLERQLVEQWLAKHPEARLFFAELNRIDLTDEAVRRAQADVWARLQRDMAFPPGLLPTSLPSLSSPADDRTPVRRISGVLKAAAVIAVLLGGSLVVWQTARSPEGHPADLTLGTIAAPAGLPPVSVSLPDGSQAVVSPGSTLRYAATFGADRREVELEGEAYFAVTHDAARPFLVQAGDLVVQDLGTEFIVRAYPEDAHPRVIVREGVVGIADTTVRPGQLGWVSHDGVPVIQSADTASWFAWTEGQLSLAGLTLREALPKLRRWYDMEFRLADSSLGDQEMYGRFSSDIDEALTNLTLIPWLRFTREGRVVTFHAVPANPS